MADVLSIWRDSSTRAKGLFVGCLGIASLLLTFAPVWDSPAGAEIGATDYTPKTGPAGTQITFTGLSGCLDTVLATDVIIEINTESTFLNGRDFMALPFEEDGTYTIEAPPEYGFQAGLDVGPTYDVGIACVTEEDLDEQGEPATLSARVFQDGYTYPRASTTSSSATTSTTAATTSTTGATTSTTDGTTSTTDGTTSTTGATTSTTDATTSTTDGTTSTTGATTSTTDGTTSTTDATTSTTDGTTSTTGATTSSTGASTSSTTGETTSTTGETTSTTGDTTSTTDGTTSSTGAATSSTTGSSSTAAPSSTSAPACTAADTTLSIGQSVALSCGGFAPGTTVTVDLFSDPVRLATLTANAGGTVTGTVRIPLDTPAGSHELRFTGTAADGTALVRSLAVQVARELPRTGDDTWTFFRTGLLLVGVGLLATGRAQVVRAR